MAINILQELNLGSAKPSFSRDEVASLADIKNLDVATKYPNNYEIYCREDGCKYRLNKVAHSTMQDNLPHPTGKWRRSDAVISSTMPTPITTGDVILYLGPTVMDPSDQTKVKYQTGKYYRTEWAKTSKQMYAFTQVVESNAPIMVIDDGSGNQSTGASTETKVWYSDTLDITTDTVLFTPDGEGALFENREHAIIVKSTWDGESAITDYVYGDGSADAKPELTRDSTQDEFFDSYPALVWKLFDTEAEAKEAAANAENALEKATRMDSLTDEMISEITEARESIKEFIYGGNMDGFVEVYNREAEFMYEMDLEKQKSRIDIASYFYQSDSFRSLEYTTDAGSTYTLYVFQGPAYYFVPYPTDAIDLYLTSAAEEGKITYENRVADASGSEEALETINKAFVTSAVNDNKCLLVSNAILLNAENEEETRTVSATELDNILTNDVEVTLGTYSCDTFTYDIDEVYVGLSIYLDALKMIHDFKPEQEQSEAFEMYSKMFKLMYDYNDGNMPYLRIGVRNTENPSENHIRITLGDEEFFGGLKDYLLSRVLSDVEQAFNEAGATYTEEAALEYLRIRLSIISYIHIHRDNEAILDVNSLYDSNLSNSLAEHIRVLGGDKNFIDRTNEGLQSLKTNLKNSKVETKKSISEIKTNMSDMRTKIENTDSKIENTNSKIESRLPERTADFIKDSIFATKSVELSEAPNYFDGQDFDRTTYTSLIGLGVETYSLSSTSGSISPEFVNYCDESRDDLVAPTDFIVYDKDSQGEINYPWDSFVGILGTIEYDQDLGAALSGYKIQYDRNKTLNFRWDKDDNFYKLSVADVYINVNTSRDADDVHNSGWVLVEPETDLGEAFADIAEDTSYTKYAQIIIVVNAHPEDTYSKSLDFVVNNFDKVFNDLLSIENYKMDTIDMSSYDARLDKIIKLYTPKYKRLNWTDSYSGEPYYYNSMINLGINEYNPENDGYTLNPTFMNYLTYGHPGDPTYAAAIEAMISNKYVGINTYLEKDYSTMNLLKEASKKMTVRFDKNASTIGILKDDESGSIYYGITLSIKDVYITISNSDNALAPYTACTPIRIASGGNIYDYIKDLSISGSLFYIGLIFIVEVNKTNSTPSLTSRLSQVEFDRAINELCEVSYNVARNAEDKVSELGDISTITNRVSTLEDNMSGLSEFSQLIDKHPAQILISNETTGYTYNGLIDLGLDSFDPASTEALPIQPTHKDYYSSSKTIDASTLFVSDKYIGVCAYIDSLYNPAETVKDAMKDIVIRYKKDNTALAYVGNNTTPDNITLSIKDVYMTVSTTNYAVAIAYSFGNIKFRIPENDTTSIYEYIKDLKLGSPAVVEFIFIFEVVPSQGYVMSADYYLPSIDFARAINQLCEISRNPIKDAQTISSNTEKAVSGLISTVDEISGTVGDLSSSVNTIEGSVTNNTSSINSINSNIKSLIQKYPIKLAYSFADDTKFNGALKINADTYDPETTTSVSLSFYNYYDSSKDNYRNPVNPATPMLVEDKFVAVAAYIDIPEVLGIPPYSSASQLKEYCKNISVRFDRTQSIKVDLQNNNNTSVYSGANVFIRDVYFKANSITQAPVLASYTYSTKITNSNPIAELVDASYSPGFIPIFIFILEVIPDDNYSVPLKNYLAQQNFGKFINSLCEISFNKVRDAEDKADKAQEAVENISSVADSVDNISDSMSDYMSAKWLPTPIAFPDRAYENQLALDGKDFDFLLYPTFVDTPHSEGSYVEGKNSNYTVYPIPESGENTTVKALYESENSMYLLFGFFGERLLPESLGGDYAIPETYNENTIESFNRVSKTLWYSDIYMNMRNTFSYSMIKGINDSLFEIDISNVFLNFDPRVIKSLYAKVTATPNLLANPSYTNPNLSTMQEFIKVPYVNTKDINTISMEDIVNMCGRPYKTETLGSSKAIVLFVAEINKDSFPALSSLTTPAYGVSSTTSDNLAIYRAMFVNNESSPIYMARSIDDSLKKTKEVAVEAARYAASTLTAAREYSSYSDLKLLIQEGQSGYVIRDGETEGTTVADVYIKTVEGALIKIASGVEYEAPVSQSQSQGPSIVIDDGN